MKKPKKSKNIMEAFISNNILAQASPAVSDVNRTEPPLSVSRPIGNPQFDPMGSYIGVDEKNGVPSQDADDL